MYNGPYPSRFRTVIGFLVAPIIAGLPVILANPPEWMTVFLMVSALAYAHVLFASFPLFLWLRRRRVAPTFFTCVLAGGASVILLWVLVGLYSGPVVLLAMGIATPLGVLGGALFWLIACWGVPGIPFVPARPEEMVPFLDRAKREMPPVGDEM